MVTETINLPTHIQEVFAQSVCLYTKKQVEAALDRLAEDITARLSDSNPVFLCVVLGGIVPVGNLLPRLDFPLEIDYVHASRYENDIVGKEIVWKARPSMNLKDRTVVVVDDILDGGVTLAAILADCQIQQPKTLFSAVLVDKVKARLPNGLPQADFTGLTVDNHYVFGYGMDYKGYLRNAPGIYRISDEHEK